MAGQPRIPRPRRRDPGRRAPDRHRGDRAGHPGLHRGRQLRRRDAHGRYRVRQRGDGHRVVAAAQPGRREGPGRRLLGRGHQLPDGHRRHGDHVVHHARMVPPRDDRRDRRGHPGPDDVRGRMAGRRTIHGLRRRDPGRRHDDRRGHPGSRGPGIRHQGELRRRGAPRRGQLPQRQLELVRRGRQERLRAVGDVRRGDRAHGRPRAPVRGRPVHGLHGPGGGGRGPGHPDDLGGRGRLPGRRAVLGVRGRRRAGGDLHRHGVRDRRAVPGRRDQGRLRDRAARGGRHLPERPVRGKPLGRPEPLRQGGDLRRRLPAHRDAAGLDRGHLHDGAADVRADAARRRPVPARGQPVRGGIRVALWRRGDGLPLPGRRRARLLVGSGDGHGPPARVLGAPTARAGRRPGTPGSWPSSTRSSPGRRRTA